MPARVPHLGLAASRLSSTVAVPSRDATALSKVETGGARRAFSEVRRKTGRPLRFLTITRPMQRVSALRLAHSVSPRACLKIPQKLGDLRSLSGLDGLVLNLYCLACRGKHYGTRQESDRSTMVEHCCSRLAFACVDTDDPKEGKKCVESC